ncbi:unnamed protein product [Urochloa decumbens]|uniref:Serine protease n=1 Tax=Urochloa decumbens TaxID=240449 RepID=A0ABC8YDS5_9POAL
MSSLDALIQATVRDYRDSVVTILTKEREAPKLSAVGSGFIIRSAQNKCLVMACWHVFQQFDPSKHTMHARLTRQNLELDAELLCQDEARHLILISVKGMPRMYRVLEFCESSNVPVLSDVILMAFFSTYPNIFSFGEGVSDVLIFALPGVIPGKISAQPQETDGVVHHSCTGTEGCYGGPLIFNGRVIGVHIGRSGRIGLSASTETVNAALKAWFQIPPDVTKTTREMIQSLPI